MVLILSLAFSLAIVSLVLIAAVTSLGVVVFGLVRKSLADLLVNMTTTQQSATRLLQELVAAELELRPVTAAVRQVADARVEAPGSPMRQAPAEGAEGDTRKAGVAPIPRWVEVEMAERRAREAEIARQETDAVAPRAQPWDEDDRRDPAEEMLQIVTPGRDSKLAAAPPG